MRGRPLSDRAEIVAKLLPRGWRLRVEARDTADSNEHWVVETGNMLQRARGYGRNLDDALESLSAGLVELLLPTTVRKLRWRLIQPDDPELTNDYHTVLVALDGDVLALVIDLNPRTERVETARRYVSRNYPDAAIVTLPPEVVANAHQLSLAVANALLDLKPSHRGQDDG